MLTIYIAPLTERGRFRVETQHVTSYNGGTMHGFRRFHGVYTHHELFRMLRDTPVCRIVLE